MRRLSSFYSVAFQSRNLHQFIRNNYSGYCSQCMKLHRRINNVYRKSFYGSTSEKYIKIHADISVKEIAEKLNVQCTSITDILKDLDYDTRNGIKTILDVETAELIAEEYGFRSRFRRPPIVTIMGHVDHGKTTLLDNLRNTSVALNEAGGITQSIGAFSVKVPGLSDTITFVDTPGHAAFNFMRARGAQLTDIVILVVAADDGVMEQTKECLKHIAKANVPFIIAVNKIDKENANPKRVQIDLLRYGVQLEGYGGDAKFVNISALKGTNIDQLLLLLNTFAEEKVFEGLHDGPVEAVILEVEKDVRKGILASVLMKNGKLTKGKVLVSGKSMCKVRQMYDANGDVLNEAFPSDPVLIIGWRSSPVPGDEVIGMESEEEARDLLKLLAQESKPVKVVQKPQRKRFGKKGVKQEFKGGRNKRVPDHILERQQGVKKTEIIKNKEINIVVKADVNGSLEALVGILSKFHSKHVKLNIVRASVGQVTITDLQLAETFDGIVYSFRGPTTTDIINKAALLNVPIKSFDVIYELLDDLKDEIEGILPFNVLQKKIGEGEVLQVFKLSGVSKGTVVAGCHVTNGFFDKSIVDTLWKVIRGGKVIHEGHLSSLKHHKKDIEVARQFSECGVILGTYGDFQEGDKIVCVELEKLKRTFEWEL